MFPRPATVSQPNAPNSPVGHSNWVEALSPIEQIAPENTSSGPVRALFGEAFSGCRRRWQRERRRRAMGRAYDMALEVARAVPPGSGVLDVGCGNGFIAHHLTALLGAPAVGIDLMNQTQASIDYRRYDGKAFPISQLQFDAVLLCYVLHHASDDAVVMSEVRRVLREGGLAVVYEDIPTGWVDRMVCWSHDLQWRRRTGRCRFRQAAEWRKVFASAGFEILADRPLSRWRNLTHPVSRRFFLLRLMT